MVWMAVPFSFGWVLIGLPYVLALESSVSLWLFYCGRFITGSPQKKLSFKENTLHTFIFLIGIQGLGGGAYLLLAPVYSMETSQISIRGTLGGAMSVMLALGGLLDNGLGAVIHWFPMTCIIGTLPSKPWF